MWLRWSIRPAGCSFTKYVFHLKGALPMGPLDYILIGVVVLLAAAALVYSLRRKGSCGDCSACGKDCPSRRENRK